jgi:hypothetical protein
MFRFTIRDVLWLTVVVALAVGWLIDNRSSRQIQTTLRHQVEAQRVEIEAIKLDVVARRVREAELQIQLQKAEVENVRLQLIKAGEAHVGGTRRPSPDESARIKATLEPAAADPTQ